MVTGDGDGELHLEILAKTSDPLPEIDLPLSTDHTPTSTPPAGPPPLSFLKETREGEEKPAILKLLDTAQLQSSSFLVAPMKVWLYHSIQLQFHFISLLVFS